MLIIPLVAIAATMVKGIYNCTLPARMRWLAPDAAASFLQIGARLVLSDMYRSAESSLSAMQEKRGVQPPSRSRHGYGRAIDLDVGATLRAGGFGSKAELDAFMNANGWYCHRIDHTEGFECWHFNYLPAGLQLAPGDTSTAAAGERELQGLFGADLLPGDAECQAMLADLRFYSGALDAATDPHWFGPLMSQAVRAFQRAWFIAGADGVTRRDGSTIEPFGEQEHGALGPTTRRVLAFVHAGAPVPA